jgi:hypothetical protein
LDSSDHRNKTRLLAISELESRVWLKALPSSNLGTLLDSQTLQIAFALRIGSEISHPHICICGSQVNKWDHHGRLCLKCAGRIPRHSALNGILKRIFPSVNILYIVEPDGLLRENGKRPDGVALIPWKRGRTFVCNVTCVDTLAVTHLNCCSRRSSSADLSAEKLKHSKYSRIKESHNFIAFSVETFGPWSADAKENKDLSKLLFEKSGVSQSPTYFQQRISIAVQRGNAASVLRAVAKSSGLEKVF